MAKLGNIFNKEEIKKMAQELMEALKYKDSVKILKLYLSAIEEKDGKKIIRLVYGQEDYDSPETKDFNMQGWASWIEKIEVGNE